MQPQGHVQVLSHMLLHGMNPQEALDAPRFMIDVDRPTKPGRSDGGSSVLVEKDLGPDVIAALRDEFGHNIQEVGASSDRLSVAVRSFCGIRRRECSVLAPMDAPTAVPWAGKLRLDACSPKRCVTSRPRKLKKDSRIYSLCSCSSLAEVICAGASKLRL